MSKVPPAVVVKVPEALIAPEAVETPLVFNKVRLVYVPAMMVCPPDDKAYLMVPVHVFPEGSGVALVLEVEMVPLFVIVVNVPPSVYVLKSSIPPAVVVSVLLTTMFPQTVFVPLVLLCVRLL